MDMLQSWAKQTAIQISDIQNNWWKISNFISTILLTDEQIFTMVTPKNLKNH